MLIQLLFLYSTVFAQIETFLPESTEKQGLFKTSESCQDFEKFMTTPKENFFNGDQVMILKDGEVAYKWSKPNVYKVDQLHIMWSTTKALTALVVAAGIEKNLTYTALTGESKTLSLESPLSDFYTFDALTKRSHTDVPFSPEAEFDNIQIKHLLMMASGIYWAESYSSLLDSSFLPILYGNSKHNILGATFNTYMEYRPGQQFNYSGGNAILLMKIIGDVYCATNSCSSFSRGQEAANALLYHPLGITDGFFETDQKGQIIASSYAYLKPEAMLKIGHLLNQGGVWHDENGNDIRILSEDMMNSAQKDNPAFTGSEIKPNSREEELIVEHGSWHPYGWGWRNTPVVNCVKPEGTKTCVSERLVYKQDFPNSPNDMFLFAGHFGNNIIAIPSENMVIATTGQNDTGYWHKLDYFTSKAVQCFGGKASNVDLPDKKTSTLGLREQVSLGVDAFKTKLAHNSMAKDMCSCLFVSEVGKNLSEEGAVELCKKNLPSDGPRGLRNTILHANLDRETKTISVYALAGILGKSSAKFYGFDNGGCRLLDKSPQTDFKAFPKIRR